MNGSDICRMSLTDTAEAIKTKRLSPVEIMDAVLPAGLQIVGRRFDDLTVLRAAFAFEQASPWADRRPMLS